MIGRTITAVVDQDHSGALLLLDDGTAVQVRGEGYETSAVQFGLIDPQERRSLAREAQGHRETARLDRLKREEWRAITCEERAARKAVLRARSPASPGLLMKAEMQNAIMSTLMAQSRMLYPQGPRTIRKPCENCGARFCDNAPVEHLPADEDYDRSFSWSTITVPAKLD